MTTRLHQRHAGIPGDLSLLQRRRALQALGFDHTRPSWHSISQARLKTMFGATGGLKVSAGFIWNKLHVSTYDAQDMLGTRKTYTTVLGEILASRWAVSRSIQEAEALADALIPLRVPRPHHLAMLWAATQGSNIPAHTVWNYLMATLNASYEKPVSLRHDKGVSLEKDYLWVISHIAAATGALHYLNEPITVPELQVFYAGRYHVQAERILPSPAGVLASDGWDNSLQPITLKTTKEMFGHGDKTR